VTGPARSWSRGLPAEEGRAVGVWLLSRLGVVLVAGVGGFWLGGDRGGWVHRWDRWDVGLFRKVAEFGYEGYPRHYPDRGIEAFLPGFPVVLRAVHVVVPSWTAAGLLVSLVAGGVAAVYLARLAALDGVPGPAAVSALVLSPYAVFLAAGYSEALFLALALPAWWCARQARWAPAGVLVGLSASVRVTGLFLAVALVVHYLVEERRLHRDAAWLLVPFAVVAGYVAYLHHLTGDWLRWQHVQADYWGRSFHTPWSALRTTWQGVHGARTDFAYSFGADIVAMAIGVLLTLELLRRLRWAEAVYVGLSVAALATGSYYLSVSRATLLWFPLWTLLAEAGARRPALRTAYVAVSAPLMVLGVLAFTSGRWVN
jgi:hypothetical protein